MSRFVPQPVGLSVREIVALTGAVPRPGARLDFIVSGIAAVEGGQPADLVFADRPKYSDRLAATLGGVCLTTERHAVSAPPSLCVLQTPNPFRDFVTVARKLYPDSLRPRSLFETEGVAERATVHPTAEIEDGAIIDPSAVIGPRAAIGAGT